MGAIMRIETGRFVRQSQVYFQTSKKRLKEYTLVGLNNFLRIMVSTSISFLR